MLFKYHKAWLILQLKIDYKFVMQIKVILLCT